MHGAWCCRSISQKMREAGAGLHSGLWVLRSKQSLLRCCSLPAQAETFCPATKETRDGLICPWGGTSEKSGQFGAQARLGFRERPATLRAMGPRPEPWGKPLREGGRGRGSAATPAPPSAGRESKTSAGLGREAEGLGTAQAGAGAPPGRRGQPGLPTAAMPVAGEPPSAAANGLEPMAGELQYLQQVRHILQHGHRKDDRTGTGTISVFGMQARYSLRGRHRGGTRGPRAAPQRWGSGAIFSARGAAEVFGGNPADPSPYSRLPRLRDTPGNAFCILGRSGSAPGCGGERGRMGREPSCCAGRGGRTGEIGLCMLEKFPLSLL